jgi:toxin ParE1/3/4
VKVTYSRRALVQLDRIFAYIAQNNAAAASEVVARIEAGAALIGEYPNIGRASDLPGIRLLPISRYPYLIFYTVLSDKGEVRILSVRHAAQAGMRASSSDPDSKSS